jgi:hypothetical protein
MRTALIIALVLAGCAEQRTPLPITPPAEVRDAAVARRPIETPAAPATPSSAATTNRAIPVAVPPNALYVCVTGTDDRRQQTVIEFAPKVASLCRRHPEMGPCQYERDICRQSGGRVYAANGQEVTRQIEDEYDRKVMRVRFRAN